VYRLKDAVWQPVGDDTKLAGAGGRTAPAAAGKTKPGQKKTAAAAAKGRATARGAEAGAAKKSFDASVYGFAVTGETMFAATSEGMLRSVSSGVTWTNVASIPMDEWRYVATSKAIVAAASLNELEISSDGGKTWQASAVPNKGRQVSALAVDGDGTVWVADRDGVSYSTNKGAIWQTLKGLFVRNVNSLFYDETGNRVLVTSEGPATNIFVVALPSLRVSWWDTGWNLRFVRPVGDYLVGATLFDGIVVQPRMVNSEELANGTAH